MEKPRTKYTFVDEYGRTIFFPRDIEPINETDRILYNESLRSEDIKSHAKRVYEEKTRRILRSKHAFLERSRWASIAKNLPRLLLLDLLFGLLPWIVLLGITSSVAHDQVLPLLVAALHGTATMSGLWSYQYFMDRTEAISVLDSLAWLVPSVLALVGDVFGLVVHVTHELDSTSSLSIALAFFYGALTLLSLLYTLAFAIITLQASSAKFSGLQRDAEHRAATATDYIRLGPDQWRSKA